MNSVLYLKLVTLFVAAIILSGCGYLNRGMASISGYTKVCVDGVTYLQFPSGVAVQVDRTGAPVACN